MLKEGIPTYTAFDIQLNFVKKNYYKYILFGCMVQLMGLVKCLTFSISVGAVIVDLYNN